MTFPGQLIRNILRLIEHKTFYISIFELKKKKSDIPTNIVRYRISETTFLKLIHAKKAPQVVVWDGYL